ncbi:MAG: hypothetical protein ACE5GH_02235 [Fidelibacterota bacterium]
MNVLIRYRKAVTVQLISGRSLRKRGLMVARVPHPVPGREEAVL